MNRRISFFYLNSKQICCFVAVFFLVLPNGLKAASVPDRLNIDFEMVERGIEWLELIKSGASEIEIKEFYTRNIVPTGGCQAIIHHWERFRKWDAEEFYDFIMKALGRIPAEDKLTNEDGSPTMFARRKGMWLDALSNPDALRRNLARLRQADLNGSLRIARSFLPEAAVIDADFYFVLFGHSNAFSVGKENGYDFLQLYQKDGEIDLDEVIGIFAHELHHAGFNDLTNKNPAGIENSDNIFLAGILAAEGLPTYFIDRIWFKIPEYRRRSDPIFRQVADEWESHRARIQELYQEAEHDIRLNLEGKLEKSAIMNKWMSGVKGPAYVLGADIFSIIDAYLGKETALRTASDYRKLLSVYNYAVEKANQSGMNYFVFDKDLVRALSIYGK